MSKYLLEKDVSGPYYGCRCSPIGTPFNGINQIREPVSVTSRQNDFYGSAAWDLSGLLAAQISFDPDEPRPGQFCDSDSGLRERSGVRFFSPALVLA